MAGGQLWGFKFYRVWETGRKPGKRPPFNPIYQWVISKLSASPERREGIAFAIMNKIAKDGTQLFQKGGRKDIFTPEFDKLGVRLTSDLGKLLMDMIITPIK
jgi:hypothetical protein